MPETLSQEGCLWWAGSRPYLGQPGRLGGQGLLRLECVFRRRELGQGRRGCPDSTLAWRGTSRQILGGLDHRPR